MDEYWKLIRRRVGDAAGRARIPGISQATADSIFSVLGHPERPIRTSPQVYQDNGSKFLGEFRPVSRQLTLYPKVIRQQAELEADPFESAIRDKTTELTADVAVHELGHQNFIDRVLGVAVRRPPADPDLGGFWRQWERQFASLTPEQQAALWADYNKNTAFTNSDRQREEIRSKALQRGWSLARRANPDDPAAMRETIRAAEAELPGTAAAYNLWIRLLGR